MSGGITASNFNFGKQFNGNAAEWVDYCTQCLATAINNDIGDGTLIYHFSTELQWLAFLAEHPDIEVDEQGDNYDDLPPLMLGEDEDVGRRERQLARKSACRTAFEQSLGSKVIRKLKSFNGGVIHNLTMRQMMNIIRRKFAVLTAEEIKKIQEPMKTPFKPHSTQTIEEYVDAHIDVHNVIEFFLPAHPLEQKIQFLIEGVAVCGLFALAIQLANNRQSDHARMAAYNAAARRRPFTFVEWTEAFLENVPACSAAKTTGNSGFAGNASDVAAAAPVPSGFYVSAEDLATYHRVQLALAATGASASASHWCYLHGANGNHNNNGCHHKHLIPADKKLSTAANPMGGPDRSLLRKKKQQKN